MHFARRDRIKAHGMPPTARKHTAGGTTDKDMLHAGQTRESKQHHVHVQVTLFTNFSVLDLDGDAWLDCFLENTWLAFACGDGGFVGSVVSKDGMWTHEEAAMFI